MRFIFKPQIAINKITVTERMIRMKDPSIVTNNPRERMALTFIQSTLSSDRIFLSKEGHLLTAHKTNKIQIYFINKNQSNISW